MLSIFVYVVVSIIFLVALEVIQFIFEISNRTKDILYWVASIIFYVLSYDWLYK